MKLIFLDIDGVLNSNAFAEKRMKLIEAGDKSIMHTQIDVEAVQMLGNYIKSRNKSHNKMQQIGIVISSSWRYNTHDATIKSLKNDSDNDFSAILDYIVGVTPHHSKSLDRGNEIKHFLEILAKPIDEQTDKEKALYSNEIAKAYIEAYAIIDDDNDMLDEQSLNFIQTSFLTGLQKQDLFKLDNILFGNFIIGGGVLCPVCKSSNVQVKAGMMVDTYYCKDCGYAKRE